MTTRRAFLGTALAACVSRAAAAPRKSGTFGAVIHSFPVRARAGKRFSDPLRFLDFCRELGFDGVQLPLGKDLKSARELRAAGRHGMYVEGSVRPPADKADLDRFETEIKVARESGATVVRTVLLGGRRYETFRTAGDFAAFAAQAVASLRLADPVMAKHKVTLAVENHKDFRTDELIGIVKGLSSEHVGLCVDTGNNVALLERPGETAERLAPWAVACHLKDMAVEPAADGFHLSEVPLGDGFLDLKGIVDVLRKARPTLRFSLEMITRDPLRVPCLTDAYWATLDNVPGRDLARTLALVQKYAGKDPLPRISRMSPTDQLAAEDRNVRRSLEHGRARLGL